MKIKVGDLRKLIRENYAREIPQYAVDEICSAAMKMKPFMASKYCKDELEHYFKMHINSTSSGPMDLKKKVAKMHAVLSNMEEEIRSMKNLKEDLKDIIDQTVRRFLFI